MFIPYYNIPEDPDPIEQEAREEITLVVVTPPVEGELQSMLEKITAAPALPFSKNPITESIDKESFSVSKLIRIYPRAAFILFGFSPKDVLPNLRPALYHIYRVDGRQIIFSEALDRISNNKRKKRMLWNCLKGLNE